MDFKSLGKQIAKMAPLLGTAIGGPVGGAAGGLISAIASKFGVEAEPDIISQAITADPQAALKLREIEANNRVELEKLAVESDKMYLLDRQSAREREIEVVKATGKVDKNLYVLAWAVVILFFVLVGILMFVTLPGDNLGPVNQLFGAMAAGFGMVLQYFFGSSKSSSDKTKLLSGKPQA